MFGVGGTPRSASYCRTPNALNVCGETPFIFMGSGGTPLESFVCGRRQERWAVQRIAGSRIKKTARRRLRVEVALEVLEDKSQKNGARRDREVL